MKQGIRSTAGALVLVACLSGCSHYEWQRQGASPAQDERDKQECEYEAAKATASMAGNEFAVAFKQQELKNQCLMLRGYRHVRIQ